MSATSGSTPTETVEARQAVAGRIAKGCRIPAPLPKRLALSEIERIPDLFQPRYSGAWQSDSHVNTLAAGIRNGQQSIGTSRMPPVLVFWIGDAWACLDGHHRIEAISEKLKAKPSATLTVEVFQGTLEDAMLEATRRNSRNKLPMNEADKSERAWRMVLMKAGTHEVIAQACGVSTKSVQRMVAAIKALTQRGNDAATFVWKQARECTKVQEGLEPQSDIDGVRAGKVRRKAEVLNKAIGASPSSLVAAALVEAAALRGNDEFLPEIYAHLKRHFANPYLEEDASLDGYGLPQFADGDRPEF